jgi:hypothetical protein
MKKCSNCNNIKDLNTFSKDKKRKDGLCYVCKDCQKNLYVQIKQKKLEYAKKYYENNKEKIKINVKSYTLNNSEKVKSRRKIYCKSDKAKSSCKLWRKKNPGKANSIAMKRRAAKLQRTPKWLTSSDWIEINWIYELATQLTLETGISHHVDHIIPLQGKNISGLHCPQNLRIITESQNCSKGNRF